MHHYEKCKDVQLIVLDDGSTDNTKELCDNCKIPVHYKYLGDNTGWRDSASFLNMGIRFALHELKADYIFITHPEIIPGLTTIESAVGMTGPGTWVSCKGYYLTADQQKDIDLFNWKDNVLNLRQLPNFYGSLSAEFSGNKDYVPESIEQIPVWMSWIFGGGSREFWQWFGGLTEFKVWGSIDVDLLNRRTVAGVKTVTPCKDTDIVIHQNHDELGTPRDMDKCMEALPIYYKKDEALKSELLHE
jgi:glycosyltransferase involved in cell wall biosynthesis